MDHRRISKELEILRQKQKLVLVVPEGMAAEDWWAARFPNVYPRQLQQTLCDGIPDGRLIFTPEETTHPRLGDSQKVICEMLSPSRGIKEAVFMIDMQNKIYTTGDFELKTKKQNSQLARAILKNSYHACELLGLEEMRASTWRIGSYFSARLGYTPPAENWMRAKSTLATRLDALKCPQHDKDPISKLLQSDDPRTIWTLANAKQSLVPTPDWVKPFVQGDECKHIALGKALLIHLGQDMVLHLDDSKAVAHFMAYVDDGRTLHTDRAEASSGTARGKC